MTFCAPFQLPGFEALLPAGSYVVETDEEAIEGHVHTAFRRAATTLRVRTGATIEHHQIDPKDLEATLRRDRDAARAGAVPTGPATEQIRPADDPLPRDWRCVPLWVRNTPSNGRR